MKLRQLKRAVHKEWMRLRLAGIEESLASRWDHKLSLHNGTAICDYLAHLEAKSTATSAHRSELRHTRSMVASDLPVVEGIIEGLVQKRARLKARLKAAESADL